MATLHCIYDPLCGWCYASALLLHAASLIPALDIKLHGGGMMMGPRRQPVTPALREFVSEHDRRIAAMSGQPFGAAYTDGLLRDTSAIFDSEPPTTAILAATGSSKGLLMLERIQTAHFVEGQKIADAAILSKLAESIGLDRGDFDQAFAALSGAQTAEHVAESRALLARVRGEGFPTFVLQKGGELTKIPASQYLGRPGDFADLLTQGLETAV